MKRRSLYFLMAMVLVGASDVRADGTFAWNDPASKGAVPPASGGRWYIAPTVGGYYNDVDRNTSKRQIYYGLAVGRFLSPNVSVDLFLDRTKRDVDAGGSWTNDNLGGTARFYIGERNTWRPYLLAGVMASSNHGHGESGWSPAGELGGGVSVMTTDSLDIRVEAGYRYDWDSKTRVNESGYGDWFLGLSAVSWFGAPTAVPVHLAETVDCAVLDDDIDDVSNCDDRCPETTRDAIVGPDGCLQQKVVIDLRGVNFKFDHPRKGETSISESLAEPKDDSLAVLNQAIDTLQRYPQIHVTVAGYTDAKGTNGYNQDLSERRAKIVYEYLTKHGIDSRRISGPIGHGENDPVGDNTTDAGSAQNRRTELQVK
ncbi:OmpA family protein [Rhodanobacter sp. Col0626]|uniref:OmpA family protein n=1 Tax=Rhodanobacter sp. Col0626 TaxID=3415679 RepID=UPI003CF08E10